jgi:hypothetical protein
MAACAQLLAVSLALFVAASNATAAGIDATLDTVTCNTFKGSLKFKPALTVGGLLGTSTEIKIRGLLDGCLTSAGVTILPSQIKGTLTMPTSDCATLASAPVSGGPLTVKWKTTPALLDSSSTLPIMSSFWSAFLSPWSSAHLGLVLGAFPTTGSFQGTVAFSSVPVFFNDDVVAFSARCAAPKGVKTMTIGLGQVDLQ